MTTSETRWGQGLTAAYLPKENIIPFSKVRIARPNNDIVRSRAGH